MTTSTPASISKSDSACRCNKDCGCCTRKALAAPSVPPPAIEPKPGFLARRPWIWVFVAFAIMFSAWGVMFTLAMKHIPENVELAQGAKEGVINN